MIPNISIDTRTINKGDLFIPIKGPNFDGRDFIKEAKRKGARVLDTKNGLKDLQKMAKEHRDKFDIPVIGITGSSGKTTTKDMLASILSQKYNTLKNMENHNNEIGVPLTLLKLKPSHQAAVVEMGMQGLGEIKLLGDIARPDIVIITNVGEAHLGLLKSKANIARAKAEILKYLQKGDLAVLPADDHHIKFLRKSVPKGVTIKTFGRRDFETYKNILKSIPLPGNHNKLNALAAIRVAEELGLKKKDIIAGLKKFKPSSKRMEFIKTKKGYWIINDTYNANPSSMEAAISVLASTLAPSSVEGPNALRTIALIGDMLELGKYAKAAHQRIGRFARKQGIDIIISVGKLSKAVKSDFHYTDTRQAAKAIKKMLKKGDVILAKASRSLRLEEVVDHLRK
ncbi:MAG: UDP-N-acetylmuramoyl-tripeptide--D-alanyl-D-alanine ligase [Candidatus Margulisbacteria bacterium]|nr:UDP-N-acetylmuramoyl-tripeptide--D-alanyl-D-alanine ligase [Candidatus Margulisiibacteriota bacterium]